ncbi:hypothetical protein J6590_041166 [Homalodisca vitripennis]|nr:hypothetical protein J6590_041166 [Homalodisca vitripennis]
MKVDTNADSNLSRLLGGLDKTTDPEPAVQCLPRSVEGPTVGMSLVFQDIPVSGPGPVIDTCTDNTCVVP